MRKRIIGGLLSLGLLAGCGGVEADADVGEETPLSTREDALDLCAATYHVKYYSDATYTTQVGREICLVCNRQVGRSGIRTQFREWIMELQVCEPYDP
ncbi:hypothetical protein D7X30_03440 [Corallococcus sp. AB011P]|uniref:hypothetical protein n=1 Tax=Corallococcus sp. AB011P TaxID=2316735 RepID=UPI000EA0E96B|nr:hypothetical protein [Corallococcus sp. AB011P]RKG62368.1 hypothetical protein D7X30_03440 [Corallococcus sp. AB011P]